MFLVNVEASCMGVGGDIPHGFLEIEVQGCGYDDTKAHDFVRDRVSFDCSSNDDEPADLIIFVTGTGNDLEGKPSGRVIRGESDILTRYPVGTLFN